MYGFPGSVVQFNAKRAKRKRGRPSFRDLYLEKQGDFFLAELFAAKSVAASLPARSGVAARTDSLPAMLLPLNLDRFQAKKNPLFFDLRRCSTADQSGLPDFADF